MTGKVLFGLLGETVEVISDEGSSGWGRENMLLKKGDARDNTIL